MYVIGHTVKRAARNFSARARAKRAQVFHTLLTVSEQDRILDLGSEDGTHIASLVPFRANVWIADIDPAAVQAGEAKYGFRPVVLQEDGTIPFPDGYFDVVFCSSVIEHVTLDKDKVYDIASGVAFRQAALARQRRFAAEIDRVGKRFFVQTPHKYFPIESHTWLPGLIVLVPRRWQVALIKRLGHFWPKRTLPDFNLLTRREMQSLFPGAEIREERFLGLTKSLIAVQR